MDKTKAVKIDVIPHVRYDENGEIVERFDVEVPRFSDENNIYITDDWIRDLAKHGHKGDESKANYSGIGKTVWYRPDTGEDKQIIGMTTKHCGNVLEVYLQKPAGGEVEIILPVQK